jgi:signal peptidase I
VYEDGGNAVVDGILTCDGEDFGAVAMEILSSGRALRFRATGGSMHPSIRNLDVLVARPVEGSPMRLGEVVLYRGGEGRLVVHRVVGRAQNGESFKVRGDAVKGPPSTVARSRVLARVVAVERGGKRIDLDAPDARLVGLLHAAGSLLREAVAGLVRGVRGLISSKGPGGG